MHVVAHLVTGVIMHVVAHLVTKVVVQVVAQLMPTRLYHMLPVTVRFLRVLPC